MFETCFGSKRTDVVFPEKDHRSTKEVEICAMIGPTKLAIEHTLIEPMHGFVESKLHFEQFVTEVDKRVPHCSIPSSYAFQLLIPEIALKRKKKKDLEMITKVIADFAIEKMAVLANPPPEDRSIPSDMLQAMSRAVQDHGSDAISKVWAKLADVRSSGRPPTSIMATPHGVRFSVTLGIIPNPRPSQLGTLRIIRLVDDIEAKRLQRVIEALKSKKEKLERRRERGYRTVLVLESNDIALTSDQAVFEALSEALSCVDAAADDIVIADTCTRTYAFRHLVIEKKRNHHWYADWVEFDANDLDTWKY